MYGYITEIPSEASSVSVADIAVTPAVLALKKTEKASLSVIGIKGGLYSNISIDVKDCTMESDTKATATVKDGIVTAVAAGNAIITVTYGDATDVVKVTVTD